MTMPREERLKALGLWPVWRLKHAESTHDPAMSDAPERVIQELVSPSPTSVDPPVTWDSLKQQVKACTRCELHASRTQGVLGVGDIHADLLIIGEAPGADEDRLGEPFVGQAGKLLDSMLAAIDLRRGQDVYIANVLKSRPPGNRDPKPDEVAACAPFLEQQIALIQPKLILALGRFAAQSLLSSTESISRLRGSVHTYHGIPLLVTYHPAYLLRNLPDKAKAWEDLCLAKATMTRLKNPDQTLKGA